MSRPLRTLALLGLATLSGAALAGQTLTGTYVEVHYDDEGIWNWSSSGMGLVYTTTSGSSLDTTYPGSPWAHLQVEYELGGTDYAYFANSDDSSDTILVVGESDKSDTGALISVYEYTAGDLEITKIEYWETAGTVLSQQFFVYNSSTSDVSNLRLVWATDADIDYDSDGEYATLNDVDDLDGDGVDDWVVSVGPYSGVALGFAPCDPASAGLGHNVDWDTEADVTLTDDDGAEDDSAMYWRHTEASLTAGSQVLLSNLVVLADDEATAEGLVSTEADLCNICDVDGDGAYAAWCGGEDCDDDDAATYPGADEVCDEVDNNCDGLVDDDDPLVDLSTGTTVYTDADADGFGDAATGVMACAPASGQVEDATDCDDGNVDINPLAQEVCDADDVDEDCDGLSDDFDDSVDTSTFSTWYADADADGYGDPASSGEACDPGPGWVGDATDCDDDSDVTYPGAMEVCDGLDNDCDDVVPGPEVDDDGDGMAECEGDCDDSDASIYTGATELAGDSIDQDCDGEDLPDEGGDDGGGEDGGDGADGGDGGEDGGDGTDGGDEGVDGGTDGDDTSEDSSDDADGEDDGSGKDAGCSTAGGAEGGLLMGLFALVPLLARRRRED